MLNCITIFVKCMIILMNISWKTIKLSNAFCKRLKNYLTKIMLIKIYKNRVLFLSKVYIFVLSSTTTTMLCTRFPIWPGADDDCMNEIATESQGIVSSVTSVVSSCCMARRIVFSAAGRERISPQSIESQMPFICSLYVYGSSSTSTAADPNDTVWNGMPRKSSLFHIFLSAGAIPLRTVSGSASLARFFCMSRQHCLRSCVIMLMLLYMFSGSGAASSSVMSGSMETDAGFGSMIESTVLFQISEIDGDGTSE